jgi:hypothetical protein
MRMDGEPVVSSKQNLLPPPPHHDHDQDHDPSQPKTGLLRTITNKTMLPPRRKGAEKLGTGTAAAAAGQQRITDFFPARRSSRKTDQTIKAEKYQELVDSIVHGVQEGLKVRGGKGS